MSTATPWDPARRRTRRRTRVTVALAAGKAFSFGYAEHAELLRAAGADVVEFDPLTDPLPPGTAALVLPGGFPEQFTRRTVGQRRCAPTDSGSWPSAGAPMHAECAGLTYLVDDLDGHPMCGVLSGSARFTERLTLGYRDAVAVADSSVHAAGDRVVGHEFHRTDSRHSPTVIQPAWVFRGRRGARGRRRRRRRRRARRLPAHPPGRATRRR